MPLTPRAAFEGFGQYLSRFTATSDADVEDQFFDRKEVPRPQNGNVSVQTMRDIKEQIKETVSAFANSNALGGLLVLGISRNGDVRGLNHLTDPQRIDLSTIGNMLRNTSAKVHWEDCTDVANNPNRIMLVYVPETTDAICETIEASPRAWKRAGPQNLPLNDRDREQLRRDKRIDAYERRFAGRYDSADVDRGLLAEIRKTWTNLAQVNLPDDDLLRELGAIERGTNGEYMFTNAGLLFFASNPQRILPQARVRILRYEAKHDDRNPRDPTLDRTFSGSITHQLVDVRAFLRESGLLRVFFVRNAEGALVEEPELPFIAVDEAIVNAVAHREYALEWQIECVYYTDALVVRNPGRLIQRDGEVPPTFRLDERTLQSTPRNPVILNWLKQSKDQKGQNFVRMLSEGTRAMLRAMTEAKLPPPEFSVTDGGTAVTLRIDVSRQARTAERASEFANLYPVIANGPLPEDWRRAALGTLRDRLRAEGWFIDRFAHGRLKAHGVDTAYPTPPDVRRVVRLYPSFVFTFREFESRPYLVIDFGVEVKNVLTLGELQRRGREIEEYVGRWVSARTSDGWREGRIEAAGGGNATIVVPELSRREVVDIAGIIPSLSTSEIVHELPNVAFDLSLEIKRRSLSTVQAASRTRSKTTQMTATAIATGIFPLRVGGTELTLSSDPVRLDSTSGLIPRTLAEPLVEFARHRETSNIREGITEFGAYGHDENEIELVPVVADAYRNQMQSLIERLKGGKFKYKGAERTFGTRFTYSSIITVHPSESIAATCSRILQEHPVWAGNAALRRLFLVHTPEGERPLDDEQSAYYTVKRLLLEAGVPCQMVDTPTLQNPDFKDLNLALNIAAKCGVVPWVLPEGIPDADFFVGLSYTQHRGNAGSRLMGYANVFNRYGRWLFYSGNAQTFAYDERSRCLAALVETTLQRLEDLSATPHVYFHYSARFSREDRDALVAAARRVRPDGTFSFVWINSHHPVRLYDDRPESDGSLARGTYVVTGGNQFYLSTTGYNPYRKTLGTPLPLEVTVWTHPPQGQKRTPADLHALARQILALTKLNWASSDSMTGEPITTKYAGGIAYLTAAFLRQSNSFTLHPALERTPWFL
jgi:predicted HTH transcriptional regulator